MTKFSIIIKSLIIYCFYISQATAQTLILNEVSNGPTGNQEYFELAVVSNSVTYNCNGGPLPCVDIRGWIFDDNSGYHGPSGVATGALRFSNNAVWSCVPLGTIILIYNDADKNPAIPPDDLSMIDGNCKIIAPVSSTLFEKNSTTPGAVSCSYPSTGWTPGGDWTFDVLANGGDCARIVNLSGCEVFSLCYGSDNLNNLIYFSGNGGQTVYYFNGVNPTNQANWGSGTASITGTSETPGATNNATNANYINQFNNSCTSVAPLNISTSSLVNASCICDGSAAANTTGGLGTYSYQWKNATNTVFNNSSTTVANLCAGNYSVIVTTSLGNCKDTVAFTINSNSPVIADFTGITSNTVAVGTTLQLTNTSTNATSYEWLYCNGTSTNSSISLPLTMVGNCCISLVATNANCHDTLKNCVEVVSIIEPIVNIPNVFTPNGDKINDTFTITFNGVKNVTLTVYNRWGLSLYSSANSQPNNLSWDGTTTAGVNATTGTYFYVLTYSDLNDKQTQKKGFISLFRE